MDSTTAPRPPMEGKPRAFIGDANYGASNSSASGSYNGVLDSVYGGADPLSTPAGTFPYPTIITVNVSSPVTNVGVALPGDGLTHEAYYTPGNSSYWGMMGFNYTGGTWWAPTASSKVKVQGDIYPFRNWAGGQPTGDATHCGKVGYALCWTWSGSAHLDFTRVHVDLTVSPAVASPTPGSSVTFTAGMSQTTIDGLSVDMSQVEWRWVGASDPADTITCSSASGPNCTRTVNGNGTLYVSAYVNGEQQQKEVIVTPAFPADSLDYSPDSLLIPPGADTSKIPDCTKSQGNDTYRKAYCNSRSPDSLEHANLDTALHRMKRLGGVCDTLADIGITLLNTPGRIKVFDPPVLKDTASAHASRIGGDAGSRAWIILSGRMTKYFLDSYWTWPDGVKGNVQGTLAHELDHLHGNEHVRVDGVEQPTRTPNSVICNGLP